MKTKGVIFVGDPHLSSFTPASRIDHYPSVILSKLRYCLETAVRLGFSTVIILGDFGHVRQIPMLYVSIVQKMLREFTDQGLKIFSVVGNHDIAYNRLDTVDGSILGAVFSSGLVTPLTVLELEMGSLKVRVQGVNYPDPVPPAPEYEGVNLCVIHRFFDTSTEPSFITRQDVVDYGYNVYIFGHDHVEKKPELVEGRLVIVPGSISRGTSHNYNLTKQVVIYSLSAPEGKPSFKRLSIPTKPASEVFSSRVESKKLSESLDISSEVGKVLDQLRDIQIIQGDVYRLLEMFTDAFPEEAILCVKDYLRQFGIFDRRGGSEA